MCHRPSAPPPFPATFNNTFSAQDELEDQKEELKLRLREMDKAVEQAQETGKADFIMRTEIEHLKQDLYVALRHYISFSLIPFVHI